MQTEHVIYASDAREMTHVDDGTVDLVVTSPPYPMIEMWDGLFTSLDATIDEYLDSGAGDAAFEAMHEALAPCWDELARVLRPGGIACINVGDATRSIGGDFQLFPNHVAVVDAMRDRGFSVLPDILWRKPSNRLTKFMGSGMLPTNAYATLEHEYILVFRKGGTREFDPGCAERYESAFFWEERNEWFSDLWTDVRGTGQLLSDANRDRSGAFPLEIPLRLIRMFSVYDDTVLDPFWGTGTTTLAAMLAGRNSLGYELDADLVAQFDERVEGAPELSRKRTRARLDAHRDFVAARKADADPPDYEATHYDFPVVTRQEREIRFYVVAGVEPDEDGYLVTHEPHSS
ncbi:MULTISPECIES: site-specific DNA-methyltransferase [unclassified Haladaptatus]|uniref:DNA-methyltransferase n=1 Tax=unclassified Haladaptatus TaxID=2622732 RepID=UPI0023E860D1|nr:MULTISPECIES: site-specific DNA-methyltransferase [unclassified Haladaptatus]